MGSTQTCKLLGLVYPFHPYLQFPLLRSPIQTTLDSRSFLHLLGKINISSTHP